MNKYELKIVNNLLKKYYRRKQTHKNTEISRRIDLPIKKILYNYSDFNVSIEEKELVNNVINYFIDKRFITASKLKFSYDYEKIYLLEENVKFLEDYASSNLGILPRTFVVEELKQVMKSFNGKGILVEKYLNELEIAMDDKLVSIDVKKEVDILKMLDFMERNKEYLYIREASMLVYGESKYLENGIKQQINKILCNYFLFLEEDIFEEENFLERFNIFDTDQEICIKGPVKIVFEERIIDINGLSGGVSFSIKDISKIKEIISDSKNIITVENKTSFLRMKDTNTYIYLGGFATKPQVTFIKKIIKSNPSCYYLHFGDIDAGGFWIHKKLCEQTNTSFDLLHMSEKELMNPKYVNCLQFLTDNDERRLIKLKNDPRYEKCINYMLKEKVKLEQEIISYFETDI